MKKYLKIYLGLFSDEGRDTRELLAAREAGFKIAVICASKNKATNKFVCEETTNVDGINIKKITLKKTNFVFFFNRFLRKANWYFQWAKFIRNEKADVLSGHDLIALSIGYMSTLFMPRDLKPMLVYDSHEFEIGRNKKRNIISKWFVLHVERFLVKRCVINIMVNDSIADEVQKIHHLSERPLVVRSIPETWIIDDSIIAKNRKILANKLKLNDDGFIVIYHGAIFINRGIEQIINAISKSKDIGLVLMGYPNSENYLTEIKCLAQEKGLGDRFLILPPVKREEIWHYTGAADVGIMAIQRTVKSYELCLPNKFFETIQSETPILASDFVEMRKLIEKYNIGKVCNSEDPQDIYDKLVEMKNDKSTYNRYKENIKVAKMDLCWENEKHLFVDAFRKLIDDLNRR